MASKKIRIAHLSGPTATIQNSPPLVTSEKARRRHGLPSRLVEGEAPRFDALRPQRLAAPAKLYVEQFSAHPLEADAAHLYGPPDGFIDSDGRFSRERTNPDDRPVYEVEIGPEDGLYALPYMARQADGRPWEQDCAEPGAPEERARQSFYPDGSRVFEEIDRFGVDADGLAGSVSAHAALSFFRILPPAGYSNLAESGGRPERRGKDFFPYRPRHLAAAPPRPALAKVTNETQAILATGKFDGAIWTQGSPNIEDTAYWFNLLIDSPTPIACVAAQRAHGQTSDDGAQNLIDALTYLRSRLWAGEDGANRIGSVLVQDQQIFAAREAAKADARPGGYVATGGHGGVIGQISHVGRPVVLYLPAYRHTHRSAVNLTNLPQRTIGTRRRDGRLERFDVRIRDENGRLTEQAIPSVSIVKDGGYCGLEWDAEEGHEADLVALIEHKLSLDFLTGLVIEGTTPTGNMTAPSRLKLALRAVFSGLPVVRVGRGSHEAFADHHPHFIGGSNLTSTKARLLLMAAMMKLGALPFAEDPDRPTAKERARTEKAVRAYQEIFDSH